MRKSQKMLKNQNNMPKYRTQDQRGNELSPSPLGQEWLAVILQCQMGFNNREKIETKKIKENKTKMTIIIKKGLLGYPKKIQPPGCWILEVGNIKRTIN